MVLTYAGKVETFQKILTIGTYLGKKKLIGYKRDMLMKFGSLIYYKYM
jgi:hypothetical protein